MRAPVGLGAYMVGKPMTEPDVRLCPVCNCNLACRCWCHPIVPFVYQPIYTPVDEPGTAGLPGPIVPFVYQPIYTVRTFMGPFTWTSS